MTTPLMGRCLMHPVPELYGGPFPQGDAGLPVTPNSEKQPVFPNTENYYVLAFQRRSKVAGGLTMLIGALVLTGWWLEIDALKGGLAGTETMKPNSALAFLMAGLFLWLLKANSPHPSYLLLRRGCAILITLVGLFTLLEYILGWELGIDQFLARTAEVNKLYPGRMSPVTALNFLLLGLAIVFFDIFSRYRTAQTLTLAAGLFALLAAHFLFCTIGYVRLDCLPHELGKVGRHLFIVASKTQIIVI